MARAHVGDRVPAARIPVPRNGQDNGFAGQHVLSLAQYGRADLELLFAVAEDMRAALAGDRCGSSLSGRLLMSAFYERSTRTRLAHETAMLRLGGTVSGFPDAAVTRAGGQTKESEDDIARMVSLYGDVVVVRHPTTGMAERAARLSRGALVINGGDGTGEHPTQALVDLYTLWQRFGRLDGLRILLTNDLRMRCAHSLLLGLRHFGCTVYGVSAPGKEPEGTAPDGVPELVLRSDVRELLPEVDMVYSSPTVTAQRPGARQDSGVVLDRALLEEHAGQRTVIMHPLPRGPELATDVDDTRFNGYWQQAANGVPLRMALLDLMFGW
jgi:aspartate carbamoyltransferase catalytic subunit